MFGTIEEELVLYFIDIANNMKMKNPSMLVVVETLCDPLELRNTFEKLDFGGFLFTKVNGYAGGILIIRKMEDICVTL